MHRHRIRGALLAAGLGITSMAAVQPPALGAGPKGVESRPISAGPATPGDELWATRSLAGHTATAMGVSPDGSRVFVTGTSFGSTTGGDFATAAYDAATGAKLWGRRHNGPENSFDYPTALAVSPDDSKVFVTGYSIIGATQDYVYVTVAYDVDGTHQWTRRYNGSSMGSGVGEVARAVGVSPDGSTVFVTGYSPGPMLDPDYATVAYDAVTGATQWTRRYAGPGDQYDFAYSLGVSPDGAKVFVTGTSPGSSGDNAYTTIAYDAATGAQLWEARFNAIFFGYDVAYSLGVTPDGSKVLVTGTTGIGDYATVAYDSATGTQLWDRSSPTGSNYPNALAVSPDGSRVFVAGTTNQPTSKEDYISIAYAASTGAQLWRASYNGPANGGDDANAVVVSPNGSSVFVTGSTDSGDYGTVAYDAATGAQLWVARYNGPADGVDEASAAGVSPDGSTVFVTGSSDGLTAGKDFATVAYSTE